MSETHSPRRSSRTAAAAAAAAASATASTYYFDSDDDGLYDDDDEYAEFAEMVQKGKRHASNKDQELGLDVKYYNPVWRAKTRHQPVLSQSALTHLANQKSQLIPITVDINHEGIQIKDQFTWNCNDPHTKPEQFAEMMVDDLEVPGGGSSSAAFLNGEVGNGSGSIRKELVDRIARIIRERVDQFRGVAEVDADGVCEIEGLGGPDGNLDGGEVDGKDTGEEIVEGDESGETIVVEFDIMVGHNRLLDKVEWPLYQSLQSPSPSPEEFAKSFCADLGIGGEFVSKIATTIREQVCIARGQIGNNHVGLRSSIGVRNSGRGMGMVGGSSYGRKSAEFSVLRAVEDEGEFSPVLKRLNDDEIERIQKERVREARRVRRAQRSVYARPRPSKVPYQNYIPRDEERSILQSHNNVSTHSLHQQSYNYNQSQRPKPAPIITNMWPNSQSQQNLYHQQQQLQQQQSYGQVYYTNSGGVLSSTTAMFPQQHQQMQTSMTYGIVNPTPTGTVNQVWYLENGSSATVPAMSGNVAVVRDSSVGYGRSGGGLIGSSSIGAINVGPSGYSPMAGVGVGTFNGSAGVGVNGEIVNPYITPDTPTVPVAFGSPGQQFAQPSPTNRQTQQQFVYQTYSQSQQELIQLHLQQQQSPPTEFNNLSLPVTPTSPLAQSSPKSQNHTRGHLSLHVPSGSSGTSKSSNSIRRAQPYAIHPHPSKQTKRSTSGNSLGSESPVAKAAGPLPKTRESAVGGAPAFTFDPNLLDLQLEMMRTGKVISGDGSGGNGDDKKVVDTLVKKHRGFGASANVFNSDGSIDVGEFRRNWNCSWCLMSGKHTPTLRKGPLGSKTLCNACGIWFGKHGTMPQERFREYAE
ncbi:SWI/SNF chromatin-remodeling complex subunit [Blyttiomyces sp. JEL0837]|nr:SWI/SNF chromatin-remodeling complex subunit [Blyttiomyces sp. JEL0837]